MDQALEGIRIVDLSRVLAGPYCTMLLADLGAEVIKIERPDTGDDSRFFGPFVGKESLYFQGINRNKKSIELNLKDEKDKELLLDLVREADVVVENFRPGTMEKLGLGYEVLKAHNPQIIYAAASGFGTTGPYSKKPAYDLTIQALGGIMSITGQEHGQPTKVGPSIADINAGIFTALGITTALFHRERTGEGQMIDVAMLDCQVAVLENAFARYTATGENPAPVGNRHPAITPFCMFDTSDDYMVVAIGNEKLWNLFCHTIGKAELLDDERFQSNKLRTEHRHELEQELAPLFKTKTTREWLDQMDPQGIPCAPVNRISDVTENEQIRARQMFSTVDHPELGPLELIGMPIKFSKTPGVIGSCAPSLGQHNTIYKDSANE